MPKKLNNIKLIVTDLDGTVLEHGVLSNAKDKETLIEAQRQGILLSVATGQSWHSAKPRLDLFEIKDNLDLAIVANGAMISKASSYEPLYVSSISNEIVQKMYDKSIEMDFCMYVFNIENKLMQWNGVPLRAESMVKKNWPAKFNVKKISGKANFDYNHAIQMMTFIPFEQEKEFTTWCAESGILKYVNSMKSNIESMPVYEFINVEANKGTAILKLAEMVNVDVNEIVVFGDNMNDVSMFEKIPHAVAMENGVDDLKSMAKYITDTNINGGVGKFIRENILE